MLLMIMMMKNNLIKPASFYASGGEDRRHEGAGASPFSHGCRTGWWRSAQKLGYFSQSFMLSASFEVEEPRSQADPSSGGGSSEV